MRLSASLMGWTALSWVATMSATSCKSDTSGSQVIPLIFADVLEQSPGNLNSDPAGISITSFHGPESIRSGEYFTVRLGSLRQPGGGAGSVKVRFRGSEQVFSLRAFTFPSSMDQGPSVLWSTEVRGRLDPNFSGDPSKIAVEFGLVDASGIVGPTHIWTPSLVQTLPPTCPSAAQCGAAQCGIETQCGLPCGDLAGSCAPGLVCSLEQTCVAPMSDCPSSMQCNELECGPDPICGVSCGTCESGTICDEGSCVPDTGTDACGDDRVLCQGECIDPANDERYCGAFGKCEGKSAGTTCFDGYFCADGTCVASCPVGKLECDGNCVDPLTDESFCGASGSCEGAEGGVVCPAGSMCIAGMCSEACAAGKLLCDGNCIDPLVDVRYCGASADCLGADAGEHCKDDHRCENGTCILQCDTPLIECDEHCVDPLSDIDYCGATAPDCSGATACRTGQICEDGLCTWDCEPNEVLCDERCIDPKTNKNYCGAIGPDCSDASICTKWEICEDGICVDDPDDCGQPCDLLGASVCGAGEQCTSWICDPDASSSWNASVCATVGDKAWGEACEYPWQAPPDECCGLGLTCFEVCLDNCEGMPEAPTCPRADEACLIGNDDHLAICLPKCDPLDASDCESDKLCLPNGVLNNAFICSPPGSDPLSQEGEPCEFLNSCEPGLYCIHSEYVHHDACPASADACCSPFCDLTASPDPCPPGNECSPYAADPGLPGLENLGICISPILISGSAPNLGSPTWSFPTR